MQSANTVSHSIRSSELDIQYMGGECLNHWRESNGKPYTHFAHLYLRNGYSKTEQINSDRTLLRTYRIEPIWTLLPEYVGIGPCNVGTPHE